MTPPARARSAVPATRLHRLGGTLARHPSWFAGAWLVLVVLCFGASLGGVTGTSLFDRLSTNNPSVPGEARTGRDLLDAGQRSGPQLLVQVDGARPATPALGGVVRALAAQLRRVPHVDTVESPFTVPGGRGAPRAAALLARGDPRSGGFLMVVTLHPGLSQADQRRAADVIRHQATDALHEVTTGVRVGGAAVLVGAITGQLETDLRLGEGVALPISLVVMVLVFGGIVAAGMPILGAIASIGGGLACLLGFSYAMDLDVTVVNIVTVLGLGLCIDYGLLIVSRFREELRTVAPGTAGSDLSRDQVVEAAARTVASAGRTVTYSALTVAISLTGLMVFQAPVVRAIGAAGVSVVVVALLVALTLVPALCVLGARRLGRRGSETAPEEGVFSSLATGVQRRPALVVLGVLAVLTLMALPALQLRITSSGTELLPADAGQRVFFDDLARDYPLVSTPSVTLVARAPVQQVQEWAEQQAPSLPGVKGVDPPRRLANGVVSVGLRTSGGALGQPARDLVEELRGHRPSFPSWVTGQAAELSDFTASVLHRAPWVAGFIAVATFVLLFLMTGSVVIPLKALVLNVLSLGASLGALVWVFQWGHLSGLLGFESIGAIESTIPLLLLAFGFGLSMDYEVFLLSRILELHHDGLDDDTAVRLGLQRSGRIITSAALLMVIVFCGFAAGKLLVVKETGVGLAVAVLLDATLVRVLVVPATMTLLGRWNWWSPPALRRLHERFGVIE